MFTPTTQWLWQVAITALLLLNCVTALAHDLVEDLADRKNPTDKRAITLPYAFHTELLDTGVGVVYLKQDQWQPQDSLVLTAYGTTNDSWGVAGSLRRARFGDSRWFMSPMFYVQRNKEQRFYTDAGFGVDETRGGNNDSNENDFFRGTGWNAYAEAKFNYVVPIGLGRTSAVHRYETNEGQLIGGSARGAWNPLRSGRTIFELKPFAMQRSLVVDPQNIGRFPPFNPVTLGQEVEHNSNGILASLRYDNRDFVVNPSSGSFQKIQVGRDFGWFGSSNSWTSVEAEASKYFNLGETNQFQQRVLALNAWTAHSPTWNLTQVGSAYRIDHAPPENMGASLGGLNRLRGYPGGRFSDKAAVYYSAELRVIPKWNPLARWPLLRDASWRWWQLVGFAEIGRVAPHWDAKTLHRDMKWSFGASLRAMMGSTVARVEIARSAENTELVVMVDHPF